MHQVQITKVNRPMETVMLATPAGISEGGGSKRESPRVTVPVLRCTGKITKQKSFLEHIRQEPSRPSASW